MSLSLPIYIYVCIYSIYLTILDGTEIKELSPMEHPSQLINFSLKNCLRLESLPESTCEVKSLQCLCLSGSSKLDRLPKGPEILKALKELELEGIGSVSHKMWDSEESKFSTLILYFTATGLPQRPKSGRLLY